MEERVIETNEAWVRNKLSPVVNLFAMTDTMMKPDVLSELSSDVREALLDLFDEEIVKAQASLREIMVKICVDLD